MAVNNRVYALVQGAMLSALVLALMTIHFSIAGAFIALAWLVPLVFASAAASLPLRVLLMVIITSIVGCLLMFGVVTGMWAAFYALYGAVIGGMYRLRVLMLLRVLVGAVVFWFLFQGVIVGLILLVGVVSTESVLWLYQLFEQHYWFIAAPLIVIALANSLISTKLIGQVFHRLSMTL